MLATDTLPVRGAADPSLSAVSRQLIVTWQHPETRLISPVGRLHFDGHAYEFFYIRHALDVEDFRPLLGFPELHRRYRAGALFPLFAQRAMDPRRSDYVRYVHRLGLEEDTSPWEQIARSGGRREGDALQLMPVPTADESGLSALFLAHGVRYMVDNDQVVGDSVVRLSRDELEDTLADLRVGDSLKLVPQPSNRFNDQAVLLVTDANVPVGFVPNLLLEDLHVLRERWPIEVTVAVINGPDAPWHLRVLVRLTAHGAADYRFFVGDKWQPLSEEGIQ